VCCGLDALAVVAAGAEDFDDLHEWVSFGTGGVWGQELFSRRDGTRPAATTVLVVMA
jgi:hypothetical protein